MYMESVGLWNEEKEKEWIEKVKKDVMQTFGEAEKCSKPQWDEMLKDVYKKMPRHLSSQLDDLKQHLGKYKEHYPIKGYSPQ
ncbi:2-oxoisovalerate dehydrogenase subunit alpha mitochondrial [Holotrichia oblita]|uniref:2-oxoisovalerate dehydrogenase subunit alpha mitochondrial n=1 Tax=Holotrichia oblita TaxID=644536 RepID=A0ACB9SVL6_HOLOL|nr:2-oxoisovalerate dehydrogenase subunit alpha mitochondrial [Holotrichia oblita]